MACELSCDIAIINHRHACERICWVNKKKFETSGWQCVGPSKLRTMPTTFDLYSSRFLKERMAGFDGSIFEWDFATAIAMPIGGGIWTWNSNGSHLARALSQRSGGHSVFFTCVALFHYYTYGKDSRTEFHGCFYEKFDMHKQCVPGPFSSSKGLGTRLSQEPLPWGIPRCQCTYPPV